MSKIQVNEIVNHFDTGAPDCPRGLTVTGVSTFSGSVSIGGTLSYEDVTNIDSVGIITAQSGINVTGGNVDVGNILTSIGGVRTNIDGSVVINPASSLSSTAQRFILYKDRSANTDMAVVFTKAGRADFAGRLYSNEWFQADRSDGTNSAFYATVSGTEKLNIRANGSASFAAGAFAIESDGDISTNVRCHGLIELDSTGAFTSPKIKLFSNTGNAEFAGSVSKGSGSFRIDHPLPAKTETHHLVHSFIEGPQADLIYRGVVDLVGGTATVNVDTAGRMTEGTFAALCTNISCFTSNESDWTAVKGSVTGNILTITAQDNASTSKVSWMVVGERKDQHMIDTDWTDENGRVIIEPLKS